MKTREEIHDHIVRSFSKDDELECLLTVMEVMCDIRDLLAKKDAVGGAIVCEHNLIDYHQHGAWSASFPPPNKMCTKCLIKILV